MCTYLGPQTLIELIFVLIAPTSKPGPAIRVAVVQCLYEFLAGCRSLENAYIEQKTRKPNLLSES